MQPVRDVERQQVVGERKYQLPQLVGERVQNSVSSASGGERRDQVEDERTASKVIGTALHEPCSMASVLVRRGHSRSNS